MMRKTVKSSKKNVEVIKTSTPAPKPNKFKANTYSFPVDTKFLLNGKINWVRKAYFSDNTEMRLVYADGNEEIVMLSTLQSEADFDNEFIIIDE